MSVIALPIDKDLEPYYKPHYSDLLYRIQDIRDRAKTAVLQVLADGQWHSQMDLMRVARRTRFIGDIGFGMMVEQMRDMLGPDFLTCSTGPENERFFKIQDNYVGLTRAAYYKYDLSV